jgi:hypothetical protein
MNNRYQIHCRGFVALVAVLAMSMVLTTMTASVLLAGWYTRFAVLDNEAKVTSRILARSCLDRALAELETSESYTGDATTTNSTGTCYIFPINRSEAGGVLHIHVRANVVASYTNLVATLAVHDTHMSSTPADTSRTGFENTTITISEIREVSDY